MLPHPNNLHLQSAIGWIELGNWREANEELEQIEAKFRAHPEVLKVRYAVYGKADKWDVAEQIASAYATMKPEDPWGWNNLSVALHRQGRTQAALDLLASKLDEFSRDCQAHYNLACYCAQLGDTKRGVELLGKAFDLSDDPNEIRLRALNAPCLDALWREIPET